MSDPVVEELLEKGARAEFERVRVPGDWDDLLDDEARHALRDQFAAGLDAVFPGWREGITRQWGYRIGLDSGPVGQAGSRAAAEVMARMQRDQVLVRRWVGPWVPVEEGTDE